MAERVGLDFRHLAQVVVSRSRHRETVHFPLAVDYFRSKVGCTFFSASTVTGPSRPDGNSGEFALYGFTMRTRGHPRCIRTVADSPQVSASTLR
jgi:hypothetical protein